jgi:hypothetical protein
MNEEADGRNGSLAIILQVVLTPVDTNLTVHQIFPEVSQKMLQVTPSLVATWTYKGAACSHVLMQSFDVCIQ